LAVVPDRIEHLFFFSFVSLFFLTALTLLSNEHCLDFAASLTLKSALTYTAGFTFGTSIGSSTIGFCKANLFVLYS
jgi:hypothetical protein